MSSLAQIVHSVENIELFLYWLLRSKALTLNVTSSVVTYMRYFILPYLVLLINVRFQSSNFNQSHHFSLKDTKPNVIGYSYFLVYGVPDHQPEIIDPNHELFTGTLESAVQLSIYNTVSVRQMYPLPFYFRRLPTSMTLTTDVRDVRHIQYVHGISSSITTLILQHGNLQSLEGGVIGERSRYQGIRYNKGYKWPYIKTIQFVWHPWSKSNSVKCERITNLFNSNRFSMVSEIIFENIYLKDEFHIPDGLDCLSKVQFLQCTFDNFFYVSKDELQPVSIEMKDCKILGERIMPNHELQWGIFNKKIRDEDGNLTIDVEYHPRLVNLSSDLNEYPPHQVNLFSDLNEYYPHLVNLFSDLKKCHPHLVNLFSECKWTNFVIILWILKLYRMLCLQSIFPVLHDDIVQNEILFSFQWYFIIEYEVISLFLDDVMWSAIFAVFWPPVYMPSSSKYFPLIIIILNWVLTIFHYFLLHLFKAIFLFLFTTVMAPNHLLLRLFVTNSD